MTKHTLTRFAKKALLPSAVIGTGVCFYRLLKKRGQNLNGSFTKTAFGVATAGVLMSSPAHAQMSEQLVMNYAQSMQNAANSQNISQLGRLLSDDVVVSLTRQGRGSSTLDKSGYLDLLQKSWTQASNYRYTISVNDIIITGDTARAQVVTRETWTNKDGKQTVLTTTSRATLGLSGANALLLRSVSQMAMEQGN